MKKKATEEALPHSMVGPFESVTGFERRDDAEEWSDVSDFTQHVTISIKCSQCEKTEQVVDVDVKAGSAMPVIALPQGWIQYGEYLFCPVHDLQFNIICDRRVLHTEARETRKRR
jgi:hypothetical protein